MASFSIHDLLGLGKESGTSAADHSKTEGFLKPSPILKSNKKATDHEEAAREEDDIDVESFDEAGAHQLVTVEVRTVRHAASSLSRSSSRKRKRTEETKERESTPDSDGKLSTLITIN